MLCCWEQSLVQLSTFLVKIIKTKLFAIVTNDELIFLLKLSVEVQNYILFVGPLILFDDSDLIVLPLVHLSLIMSLCVLVLAHLYQVFDLLSG